VHIPRSSQPAHRDTISAMAQTSSPQPACFQIREWISEFLRKQIQTSRLKPPPDDELQGIQNGLCQKFCEFMAEYIRENFDVAEQDVMRFPQSLFHPPHVRDVFYRGASDLIDEAYAYAQKQFQEKIVAQERFICGLRDDLGANWQVSDSLTPTGSNWVMLLRKWHQDDVPTQKQRAPEAIYMMMVCAVLNAWIREDMKGLPRYRDAFLSNLDKAIQIDPQGRFNLYRALNFMSLVVPAKTLDLQQSPLRANVRDKLRANLNLSSL